MISFGTKSGDTFWDIRGSSLETKPTENVPNGSEYTEIDTGKKYMYDEDSQVWHLQQQSGGSGGASAYILPVANENTLGGIKESDTIMVEEDGTAHAIAAEISDGSFATDEEITAILDDVFGA